MGRTRAFTTTITTLAAARAQATNIFNGIFSSRSTPCRNGGTCTDDQWAEWGQQAALEHCRSLDYKKAVSTATVDSTDTLTFSGNLTPLPRVSVQARKTRQYTTTCEKTKRVRR